MKQNLKKHRDILAKLPEGPKDENGFFYREYKDTSIRCHKCGEVLALVDCGDWGWCYNHNAPIAWNMFLKEEAVF